MEFTPQDGSIAALVSALVGWIIYLLRQGATGSGKAVNSSTAIRVLRKAVRDQLKELGRHLRKQAEEALRDAASEVTDQIKASELPDVRGGKAGDDVA